MLLAENRSGWSHDRGGRQLRLAPDKTRTIHLDEGFDFISFTIRRLRKRGTNKRYVYTTPSKKAIQKVKDGHFVLAVIDLDLPPAHGITMNGWDLARIVRAFHPGAALILLTTEWGTDLRSQADGLHRTRVMEKPIHPGELRALVKALELERMGPADDREPQSRDGR